MVLIVDKMVCQLCGGPITRPENVVAFPPFLPPSHRLARFCDSTSHRDCFERDPEAGALESLYKRYREVWDSRPKNLKTPADIDAWGREAFKELWSQG
jgi:hypothetical protein